VLGTERTVDVLPEENAVQSHEASASPARIAQ
jgi:hypothetical protein